MPRTSIPEAYKQLFASDWQSQVDQLIRSHSDYSLSELSLRLVRQEIKTRLEAEIFQVIDAGCEPHHAVKNSRIADIYLYLHNLRLWPTYGYGCGHAMISLPNFGPFPLPSLVKNAGEVANNYNIILGELGSVRNRILTETREFIYTGTWRSITLWESNVKATLPATKIFKKTMELLQLMPLFRKIFTLSQSDSTFRGFTVRISQLKSGTTILPHYGLTNTRLRLQIPLVIPAGDLFIYSHDQVRTWRLGTPIILDDSFIHGVTNNTPNDRVVLLVDLPHPEATLEQISSY